jgi:hypothetical protein
VVALFEEEARCNRGPIPLGRPEQRKGIDMPRPPNYGQERKDRERQKAAKRAEKQAAKEAARERAKPTGESNPGTTGQATEQEPTSE